jgi:hypothetical protein
LELSKGQGMKKSPLHLASGEGHYDVVEYLVSKGAKYNGIKANNKGYEHHWSKGVCLIS